MSAKCVVTVPLIARLTCVESNDSIYVPISSFAPDVTAQAIVTAIWIPVTKRLELLQMHVI